MCKEHKSDLKKNVNMYLYMYKLALMLDLNLDIHDKKNLQKSQR